MAKYSALLDACTLVPLSLADTLLYLAEVGLYRPLWSDRILAETQAAIEAVHPDLAEGAAVRRVDTMREFFGDALVSGYEGLEGAISVPDPNDAHVVAAAVRGRADVIVTANIKDFPPAELERFGVDIQSPDEFLMNQLDLDPQLVVESLMRQAAAMRNPKLTVHDLLARLTKAHAPLFAEEAAKHLWRGSPRLGDRA